MKVCHITTVHPAKDTRIFYRMCQAVAKHDVSVTLIAPDVFVDSLVQASGWNEKIGMTTSRLRRMMLALHASLEEQADIYHFHDPELIPLGLALKALRRRSAVVYDVHEDYPSQMLVKYWIPKPLRRSAAWSIHTLNSVGGRCFDGIVTADPFVQKDFQWSARDKTLLFYNFPSPKLFEEALLADRPKDFDLIYVGGMSERSGMFVLFDALKLLKQQGLQPTVGLAGYTDGEKGWQALEQGIRDRGLSEQVTLKRRIPFSDVPSWICRGRIGLVSLQPIPKFMKNIPTKMFEYWTCGLPVVASDLPPIRPFVHEEKNGLLFNATEPHDLARAISSCLVNPSACKQMGFYGRELVLARWNNDHQMGQLLQFYKAILRA
jgi:glycosyltransferase involved in cell wall biosynthesis